MKKKNFNRLFSVILAFVTLIAVMPFSSIISSAADKIIIHDLSASINEELLPEAGKEITTKNLISTSSGDVYYTSSASWHSDEYEGGYHSDGLDKAEIKDGIVFETGRTYYLSVRFEIKSQFKSSYAFPEDYENWKPGFSFRNLALSKYKVYNTDADFIGVYIILEFKVAGERTYDDIKTVSCYSYREYSLPLAQGKSAPTIKTVYNHYTMECSWMGEFEDSAFDNVCLPNCAYRLVLPSPRKMVITLPKIALLCLQNTVQTPCRIILLQI